MKRIFFSLLAILSLIYASSQDFTLIHDSLTRSYRLHLPVDYNPELSYPLVINMHGLGSNAIEQEFYSEFSPVADTFGFILAYPNGINNTWNVSSQAGTDDVGFISALIDTLELNYSIDLKRVYATGMSMGGFMSYRLACELSYRIAAIASVTGLQAFYPCDPGRPVPVMQFHGTADSVVPYAGVATTISNWVTNNNCPADPVITNLADIDTTDNSTVTVSYYGLCNDSTEVVLYTIFNGGHTWPGASYIIGVTNQDIEASLEIWNFFKNYTLTSPTGIGENQMEETRWNFYPNPVDGLATVELDFQPDEALIFSIYTLNGQRVLAKNLHTENRFLIDCSLLSPGLYFTTLSSENQVIGRQKLIVR